MFFQHDGEQVSILVEGRAHTQSVLAVVRMESSGRTLTALGRNFPSATVRALWRLSEAFRDEGRPPLSGEEEVRVLTEVAGEASTDASATSPVARAIRSSAEGGEGNGQATGAIAGSTSRRSGKNARTTSSLRRRARWLASREKARALADEERSADSISATQGPAPIHTVTQLSPPPPMSGLDASVGEAVVMEIEYSGLRVRVPERVNPNYVAALMVALASRH
jgi:hypothetical protein